MFSNEQWLANSGGDFYNGVATTSVRFDDGSTAFLSRTPSSASNQKTWTWSGWVKRGDIGINGTIFEAAPNAGTTNIFYMAGAVLYLTGINSGTTVYDFILTQVFRDPSAWYHFVIAMDTTQSTASNRTKIYINGSIVTDFSTETNPSLNLDTVVNSDNAHSIGKRPFDTSLPWDGYMAEVNFIDGLALTPTSFGETKNGVWIPIDTSGLTFGTNGFRLKFDQVGVGTASTSTIGADTSGNNNHWTSGGIVASDCAMPDSPENNFCTMNPLYKTANNQPTFSEGNLEVASSQSAYQNTFSNFGVSSGKWYVEMKQNGTTANSNLMGIVDESEFTRLQSTSSHIGLGIYSYALYNHTGQGWNSNGPTSYGSRIADGEIVGIALDLDNNKIWFSVDGTFIASGNPAEGTNFLYENIASSTYYFGITHNNSGITNSVWNFGQDSTFVGTETATSNADGNGYGAFHTAPPSGFLSLCTKNLPEPTIGANSDTQADDHFNTVLYTGNGGTPSITGVGFQPDWTWIKCRSDAYRHVLTDSSRGATKSLYSNLTDAEVTDTGGLTAFSTDGFSLGATANVNANTETFVAWNWKANGGTTVTNEAGSIDSTVQANTTAGFSIVTATSPSSGTWSFGHGLSKKPDMIIQKYRAGTGRWTTWHNILTSGQYLGLNQTNAIASSGTPFNFTITDALIGGNANYDNTSQTVVYYVFHDVEGYSKFGTYTGNGSADGTFVYTGFRPAWVMIKKSSASGTSWQMYDNKRDIDNVVENRLIAEGSNSEGVGADKVDFVSNGFKLRANATTTNHSATYIYMCFAEAPFKYANAR
mgnify:FL=1